MQTANNRNLPGMAAMLERAWSLIAAAHGGNWDLEADDWVVGARRWRDDYDDWQDCEKAEQRSKSNASEKN